jgi:hydroxymethylpyrimidine/phosphomethylpyrimidine kinase
MSTPVVLTIAATDSSTGAGVGQDLRVFREMGTHGVCSVTAVTAQDTRGVHRIHKVPPRIVCAQIDAVGRDMPIAAAKTGMLVSAHCVRLVAARIRRRSIPNVVVDPVVSASDGTCLLSAKGVEALRGFLLRHAAVVTPNLAEAQALTGLTVGSLDEMRAAARRLLDMGAGAALVKGGHLPGDPVDIYCDRGGVTELPGVRVEGTGVRGTGCMLSAAIAARLAQGDAPLDAVRAAKEFVTRAIRDAAALGKGACIWTGT